MSSLAASRAYFENAAGTIALSLPELQAGPLVESGAVVLVLAPDEAAELDKLWAAGLVNPSPVPGVSGAAE